MGLFLTLLLFTFLIVVVIAGNYTLGFFSRPEDEESMKKSPTFSSSCDFYYIQDLIDLIA